jgi:ATP-dependent Clp protease adapter protein ClpS
MSQHPSNRLPTLAAAKVSPKSEPASRPARFPLPRYKVVLLNNEASDMMFVVRTIMELTRLCREEATHKMWEAHHSGRSVLLVTFKERAELYVEQFASKGLNVVIEPA